MIATATAAIASGGSALTGGGMLLHKHLKSKEAKLLTDDMFKEAGIDVDGLTELIKCVERRTKTIAEALTMEINTILEAIQEFLHKVWQVVKILSKDGMIIKSFQCYLDKLGVSSNAQSMLQQVEIGVELCIGTISAVKGGIVSIQAGNAGVDAVAGVGTAANTAKTIATLGRGFQAFQALGLALNVIAVGVSIYSVIDGANKHNKGSKNALADSLEAYKQVIQNLWFIREMAHLEADKEVVDDSTWKST